MIEPVRAAGLTPEQLQQQLVRRYRALVYDPLSARNSSVEKKYLISVNDKLEVRFDTKSPSSRI